MDSNSSSKAAGQALQQDAKLANAKRQVATLKGTYIHLVIFTVVILGLALINVSSGGPWWAVWIVAGWGIGVLADAMAVFGHISKKIADWERARSSNLVDKKS